MGHATELRQILKQRFFPLLEAKGFVMDKRHAPQFLAFRRIFGETIQVFDIQWDKYGKPKFALNFSMGSLHDIVSHEGPIEPADAFVYNFKNKGRLRSKCQFRWFQADRQWFSQDLGLTERLMLRKKKTADDVVDDLLNVFPEVEAFFQGNGKGSHLSLHGTEN